jgi:hypothetical protein
MMEWKPIVVETAFKGNGSGRRCCFDRSQKGLGQLLVAGG